MAFDHSRATYSDFTFESVPGIISQARSASRLASIIQGLGVGRAFLIIDPDLADSSLLTPILNGFSASAVRIEVYRADGAMPTPATVAAATAAARAFEADGVIGIGDDGVMDTAKLTALLAASPQPLERLYGNGLAQGPRLRLVLSPITAGSGSEATSVVKIHREDGSISNISAPVLYPDLAVLDPRLCLHLSPADSAIAAMDALTHAIEAYTSRLRKNPISDSLALAALRLIFDKLPRVMQEPGDLDARTGMLQASLLAGMAVTNAPAGAVHALSYQLSSRFGLPHGLANAVALCPVLRFNQRAANNLYAELGRAILPGAAMAGRDEEHAAIAFIDAVGHLMSGLPLRLRLTGMGVGEDDLIPLARDIGRHSHLLSNNPLPVTQADAEALLRAML